MRKLSKRQVVHQKLSSRDNESVERFIKEMKETVKKDPEIISKFKEYGVPLSDIDSVSVGFYPLDVSAKTKNKKIYMNEEMLNDDSKVEDPTHYLCHELVHYLQQKTGKNITKNEADDYLDLPTEMEAFQVQVKFKEEHEGKEEADRYVEDLLSYHDISGRERDEKKERLEKLEDK